MRSTFTSVCGGLKNANLSCYLNNIYHAAVSHLKSNTAAFIFGSQSESSDSQTFPVDQSGVLDLYIPVWP